MRKFCLHLWIHCKFEILFLEAKALQDRLTKSKSKHETNEFKIFDKNIKTGKIECTKLFRRRIEGPCPTPK